MKNRLGYFVESEHILPELQQGFRKSCCTLEAITVLTSDVMTEFTKKKLKSCCFHRH